LWSMVGMQTRMKRHEQQRIFCSLPGLEAAEFVRYGSVHRNTFIESPKCLANTLEFRSVPGLFFAGQITGTEGYVEATAGGLLAGINAARSMRGESLLSLPAETAIGALTRYISEPGRNDFQPMNISFGLMPSYLESPKRGTDGKKLGKRERRLQAAERSKEVTAGILRQLLAEGSVWRSAEA
jgi:methylenetetrahydrofolate--tRNA-(uracil-5-)-methyltransferase